MLVPVFARQFSGHRLQLLGKVIAANLEKKIKGELLRLQKDEREKYETFWKAFGTQIKVGVVSDYGAHKELLQDLLLFWSSKEGKLGVEGMRPEILRRVVADLDATDLEHYAAYFLMRDSPVARNLPKRCGYLVGLAAVRRLRERHPLPEIASWSLPRVRAELRGALAGLPVPT